MSDLSGKDYFTAQEAAIYCGVSYSQFRAKAPDVGLYPVKFMGKILYRRADCQKAIETHGDKVQTGPQLVSPVVRVG